MILNAFNIYLWTMIVVATATFITLFFVEAGYGMLRTDKWGKTINNKWAWFFMEFPIFVAMIILWLCSPYKWDNVSENIAMVPLVFLIIFQSHYLQRTLIFPFLLKGKSRMPIGIMCLGIAFNILNSAMQGYWLFYGAYITAADGYELMSNKFVRVMNEGGNWLLSWQFILGTCLFITGYIINLRSDYIIRHLRKNPTDIKHYFPKGFMFNHVTSANYFGELVEWLGFAILTWTFSGFVFLIWTFANLVPRANAIYKRYKKEFPEEMSSRKLKRVIPFIY